MKQRTKTTSKPRQSSELDRVGVALPKDVRKMAMTLAGAEKRSFSNFINVLIEREWERKKIMRGVAA